MNSIFELKEISKIYNGKTIVEGISFAIAKKSINVLVGPNGSGKTTIARIVAGIEKPTSGSVVKDKATKIAYVPQSFVHSYQIPIRAADFISSFEVDVSDVKNCFYYSDNNIDKLLDKQIDTLSGGELQSLMLSVSIALKPNLIVLDEPTSFLDVDLEARFYELIEDRRKGSETSFFIVSHDLHSVISSADQVLCINHHICCTGKPFKTNTELHANIGVYKHIHDHQHQH